MVITVAIYTLFISVLLRRTFRQLPIRIKISILVFMVYSPCTVALMLMITLRDNVDKDPSVFFETVSRDMIALEYGVWLCLQWQFTAYYLLTACLFRKTFQAQSDHLEKMQWTWSLRLIFNSVSGVTTILL